MFKTDDLVRLINLTEDDSANGRRKYEVGKLVAFDSTDGTFLVRFGTQDYYVYPYQIEVVDKLTTLELYNWLTDPETRIPFKEQLAEIVQREAAREQAKAYDIEPSVCECYERGHWYLGDDAGTCNGTKEREACNCGGNRGNCDFYRKECEE